jgi:hypothetical protein
MFHCGVSRPRSVLCYNLPEPLIWLTVRDLVRRLYEAATAVDPMNCRYCARLCQNVSNYLTDLTDQIMTVRPGTTRQYMVSGFQTSRPLEK